MIKSFVKNWMKGIVDRANSDFKDISEVDMQIFKKVKSFTMTSPERVFAVLEAVRYVVRSNVPGSIVECGVWRGGTMMAIAHSLKLHNSLARDLYLFDTFQGMPLPSDIDADFHGRRARPDFFNQRRSGDSSDWCYVPLPEVQRNLASVGYPESRIHYVVGKVENTLPTQAPQTISILRLDTDWYESTRHELIHLYPRLVTGGVLIIDDYGHWRGARKAVDEYFMQKRIPIFLSRIDYTGRIGIKLD